MGIQKEAPERVSSLLDASSWKQRNFPHFLIDFIQQDDKTDRNLVRSRRGVYMNDRPVLDRNLDSKTFRDYYYLKEELVSFCRENGIPVSGGKIEITDRIAYFLDTGKILPAPAERKKATAISVIREDTEIEANFVCSEKHRAFFREHIGSGFSFNVAFQKWLKNNIQLVKDMVDIIIQLGVGVILQNILMLLQVLSNGDGENIMMVLIFLVLVIDQEYSLLLMVLLLKLVIEVRMVTL